MSLRVQSPLALMILVAISSTSVAQDSALVRLLKSGRVPEERQPQILAKIGQLGTPSDLAFLLNRAATPKALSPPLRAKALDALVDASITRKGMKPEGDLSQIDAILELPDLDAASRTAAIRLLGLWRIDKVDAGSSKKIETQLASFIESAKSDDATRLAALEALSAMDKADAINAFATGNHPRHLKALAVAVAARHHPGPASSQAATLIREASKDDDLSPLIAAFLNLKEGPALLAKAIEAEKISPDNAKLALRAVYLLGRADAPLVAALSKAAGIHNETKPPTKEEMDAIVAQVNSKGDPARGERVFRRLDLNCMKCHAIAGAAGGVGPDLSSVGLSSPVDYVVNSILLPDQAIKEQYQTLVIATNYGQLFQGIVTDKDESKIVLKQATGELKTVPTSEIDETKEGGSLMPKGLANLLTHDEFVDLVRYISGLGKPGPYAIRDKPTIQRWKILSPVSETLETTVPDAGSFLSKIRDADPSAWTTGYGLATGDVPTDEFAKTVGSPILYLRGEIEVSAAGSLSVELGTTVGLTVWLDDEKVDPVRPQSDWNVTPGKHSLTLRIDTRTKDQGKVRVQLSKSAGSSAEFVVIGGR